MGVITYGTTSTTWAPRVEDIGYIVTSFDPDDWGGNTDPQSNRELYVVYNQGVRAKYYDTGGNEKINVICSRSIGGTDKADVFAGTINSSYNTYSASTNYLVGDGTTYYAGLRATSVSGAYTTRTDDSSSPHTVYINGSTTRSGAQWLKLYFYGLPNQVSGLSASAADQSSVDLSWNAATAPDTEGQPTKYRVEYKKSTSSTWQYFSAPSGTSVTVTGLDAATSYNFRVGAQNGISSFSGFSNATGPWSSTATATTESAVAKPVWSGSYESGQVQSSYYDTATITGATSVSLNSGSLPPGLSHRKSSTSYIIEGTPTAEGTYTFEFRATNDGGSTDKEFSIYIAPQTVPQWVDQSIQTVAEQGDSYSDGVSASGANSYSSIGDLPPGMSLNSSNGNLTATELTTPGQYTFTIFATNEAGSTQRSFTITVETSVLNGGKRIDENGDPVKLSTYKRFNGSSWVELSIARRFDGTSWQDI